MPQIPPNSKRKSKGKTKTAELGESNRHPIRHVDLQSVQQVRDPFASSIWVDTSSLSLRSDLPIATLRFFEFGSDGQGVPIATEVCRLLTSVDHLKSLVNLLSRSIDYYPTKSGRTDASDTV